MSSEQSKEPVMPSKQGDVDLLQDPVAQHSDRCPQNEGADKRHKSCNKHRGELLAS